MRATAAENSLARGCGIRTDRVVDIAWLMSGAMCGLAGVTLFINTSTFTSATANEFLVVIVAAAVLGGVGHAYGAMLGALVLGLTTEISGGTLTLPTRTSRRRDPENRAPALPPGHPGGDRHPARGRGMSTGTQFYISTLLVYAGVDVLAAWGMNLQFGVAGLLSFCFIIFQAAGAYTAAVLTLGPDTGNGAFQHYIFGMTLPFPLPLLAAAVWGAAPSSPDRTDHAPPATERLSGDRAAGGVDHRHQRGHQSGRPVQRRRRATQPLSGSLGLSPVNYPAGSMWVARSPSARWCTCRTGWPARSPLGRSTRSDAGQ